ncbi:MAG: hypothetical protein ACP5UT_06340 [Bryobacteraceae bacterium]
MPIPTGSYIFVLSSAPFVRRLILPGPNPWPQSVTPAAVLSLLDGERWLGSGAAAELELIRRIENRAQELDWPPLAFRTDMGCRGDPVVTDPLTWCVAASKRVGSLVLKDKPPNLDRLRVPEELVLNFPVPERGQR